MPLLMFFPAGECCGSLPGRRKRRKSLPLFNQTLYNGSDEPRAFEVHTPAVSDYLTKLLSKLSLERVEDSLKYLVYIAIGGVVCVMNVWIDKFNSFFKDTQVC